MRKLLPLFWLLACLVSVKLAHACMAIPNRPNYPVVKPGEVPPEMELPEQRALVYGKDGMEHLILSVRYAGATREFAWVIPTETRPKVDVQSGAPFHELWRLTEIRKPQADKVYERAPSAAMAPGVTVLERKVTGPYELLVLKTGKGGGLYEWLLKNGFGLTPHAREALDYYGQKGWFFITARIRPGGVADPTLASRLKEGTIAPLHIAYKARELSYPLRVTAGNPGSSRMEVYVGGEEVRPFAGLEPLRFHLGPDGPNGFRINGPPGTVLSQGEFPTLRKLLPQGGTLTKLAGTMNARERERDMVFLSLR